MFIKQKLKIPHSFSLTIWLQRAFYIFVHIILSIIVIMHASMLSHFNHVWLSETLWTIAWQAPLSMGFSRQENWSGLPCPPPGDLPWCRGRTCISCSSCIAGSFFTAEPRGIPIVIMTLYKVLFNINPNNDLHKSSENQRYRFFKSRMFRNQVITSITK